MMILVTGGSGSGKSAFAEDCIVAFGNARRIYIATMYPFDEESRKRVKRHQAMRQGKGFDTLECYTAVSMSALSFFALRLFIRNRRRSSVRLPSVAGSAVSYVIPHLSDKSCRFPAAF